MNEISVSLRGLHRRVRATAIVAPALSYEGGRPDIVDLNSRLFRAAKRVGDELGIPTYASVVLGRSTTATARSVESTLSAATALNADGWYYAYEFASERMPSDADAVNRCCVAGLMLACTGKPVLHAYAGPIGLISLGFGATGVGIGHSQNLWKFSRARWQAPVGQGGGGDAPPRFFSTALWGTIVYPDEVVQLSMELRDRVLTTCRYSQSVSADGRGNWSRWDANKHLVFVICSRIDQMAGTLDARSNARSAIATLDRAVRLNRSITRSGLQLRDRSGSYQGSWSTAVQRLLDERGEDYRYLALL